METMVNSAAPASYIGWEKVVVSGDNGRGEVHFYLKRNDGCGPDLVVVGKEKSPGRMYYYGIRNKKQLLSSLKYSSLLKLRSRREVVDWLNSVVPDVCRHQFSGQFEVRAESKDTHKADIDVIKDLQMQKSSHYPREIMWLGSPWISRKRRKHYLSFYRNGVKISVNDFVYVLAEEDKHLVAHLDDMYEDSRGNKTVVVRWFHKIDEVGFVLPHNYNDREIFFSLCRQDLSIECIDGLATVLSPEHYEKCSKKATNLKSAPFVCYRQFYNDDIKPFDITRVKGYWRQEAIRNMSSLSFGLSDDNVKVEGTFTDATGSGPKKRLRRFKVCETYLQPTYQREIVDPILQDGSSSYVGTEGLKRMVSLNAALPSVSLSGQGTSMLMRMHLTVGSQVEVLSQDSGIRGCWFRAFVIKKHKDKIKVQYRDIKDATNDKKYLEEWILASRLAAPDVLGVRISGRTMVRPMPLSNGGVALAVNVGSIVDAWWRDGWWEGIVVKKKMEDKLHVYFPGENHEMIFSQDDLRHSQEWLGNGWKDMKERSDIVALLCGLGRKSCVETSFDFKPDAFPCIDGDRVGAFNDDVLGKRNFVECSSSMVHIDEKKPNEIARDLSKDGFLTQLKWMSYGKRRHGRNSIHVVQYGVNSSGKHMGVETMERFFAPSSLKVDPDNCKYASDTLFSSSVSSPVTSLVMSR